MNNGEQHARAEAAGAPSLPTIFLATVFAAAVCAPALAPIHSDEGNPPNAASHEDGTPCHDGQDGGPCNEGCPCLCCPGHGNAMFRMADAWTSTEIEASVDSPDLYESPTCGGVTDRVFRPPRA